jgi:hypothetical protein
MPITVTDVSELQSYLRSVIADAKHHANNVDEIILALAGAIIARKDDTANLEVHSGKGGGMGRAITATIKGNRYAFSYNHDDKCITMKAGSYQGDVLHRFTNATPLSTVSSIFAKL